MSDFSSKDASGGGSSDCSSNSNSSGITSVDQLKELLKQLNQNHILDLFPDLNEEHPIYKQLTRFDLRKSLDRFRKAQNLSVVKYTVEDINPIEDAVNWANTSREEKLRIEAIGFDAVRRGKVASIILSGGQGTRLGFDGPKGIYSIDMPSKKSIFQMHIEKISKVRELSKLPDGSLPSVCIYIMTSDLNDQIIRDYFIEKEYFGYPACDVFFFEQKLELCLTNSGDIIVESEKKLSLAPDGNGGIYSALQESGAMKSITSRGIEHLHIYGIDNVLIKSLDPAFIGICIERNIECGNKVCWRASKAEKVGVTVSCNNKMTILEYSDVPASIADAEDANGRLLYGAGNICNHYLSVPFLQNKVFPQLYDTYHIAKKKIPYLNSETRLTETPPSNNGIKMEMFIFDIFPLADNWLVMEVDRQEEFAPVKNQPGSAEDSPNTARSILSCAAIRWLLASGVIVLDRSGKLVDLASIPSALDVESEYICELSASVSYQGEGLEKLRGQTINLPCHFESL